MLGTIVGLVGRLVAGAGVQLVITNAVKATTPIGMKLIEKALTTIGSIVITDVIVTTVVDKYSETISEMTKLFEKKEETKEC